MERFYTMVFVAGVGCFAIGALGAKNECPARQTQHPGIRRHAQPT